PGRHLYLVIVLLCGVALFVVLVTTLVVAPGVASGGPGFFRQAVIRPVTRSREQLFALWPGRHLTLVVALVVAPECPGVFRRIVSRLVPRKQLAVVRDTMGRKLRHLLIFLLIILKEPNMSEAGCSCASSRCVFAHLPKLEILDLENNQIIKIHANTFANLLQLQELHLG
ncbi:uncharacterized protein LOC118407752, partial [Branchiostoma floridae]|uniref:Uncharacterized protein LOC118407752 n=1 Tax=Branchiostoma floridae TaxID=7739 RepID=A0A9J7KKW7_BRAFL